MTAVVPPVAGCGCGDVDRPEGEEVLPVAEHLPPVAGTDDGRSATGDPGGTWTVRRVATVVVSIALVAAIAAGSLA